MASDLLGGLEESFRERLARLLADAPGRVTITSGRRSTAQQAALHKAKPHLAAPPGRSRHEHGLAADLAFESPEVQRWVHTNAPRYGLRFPMLNPKGKYEPWHVEPIGSAARSMSGPTRRAAAERVPAGVTASETVLGTNEYEEDRHDLAVQVSALLGIMESPLGDNPFDGMEAAA